MTARGAWPPRIRASQGVARLARAAVIAVLAAFAVLVHHETAAAAVSSTSASVAHVMTPGMVMADSPVAPASAMSGHAHGSTTVHAADQTMNSADGLACSGMAMQHCSTASFEVVKLAAPGLTPGQPGLAAHSAVAPGPKAAGTLDRAPPDLSVLSQLRI
ncbi:hypothetical protein [Streptomyces sp. S.PNR 29]|uniref:hypothetical protein n=1 Tax=Streptomyces sp. S.PNR 29 TaxID=2973805 RepID=UPI0025B1A64E|nr:hypothetical protein [Streptomyces sp. S.PNR 29]MDN0199960.1 hypothetical protein [Streptomyces sp. S.PNR 29]